MASPNWQILQSAELKQRGAYLFKTKLWSDISFEFDSEETDRVYVKAHKLILAMASPLFGRMFYEGVYRDPVPISDIPPEVFEVMLEYIYSDNLNINSFTMASNLYKASEMWRLPYVTQMCTQYMCKHIEPKTVCTILQFCQLTEEHPLKNAAYNFITSQTREVLNEESFLTADINTVRTIFSMDPLNILSEIELFAAAVRYADAQDRKPGSVAADSGKESSVFEKMNDGAAETWEEPPPAKRPRLEESATTYNPIDQKENRETNNNDASTSSKAGENYRDDIDKQKYHSIVQKIRFLTLTPMEFAECNNLRALLTDAEILALSINIASKDTSLKMPQDFSMNLVPRSLSSMQDRAMTSGRFHFSINNFKGLNKYESVPFYVNNAAWTLVLWRHQFHKDGRTDEALIVGVKCFFEGQIPDWFPDVSVKIKFSGQIKSVYLRKSFLRTKSNDGVYLYEINYWLSRMNWDNVVNPANGFLNDSTVSCRVDVSINSAKENSVATDNCTVTSQSEPSSHGSIMLNSQTEINASDIENITAHNNDLPTFEQRKDNSEDSTTQIIQTAINKYFPVDIAGDNSKRIPVDAKLQASTPVSDTFAPSLPTKKLITKDHSYSTTDSSKTVPSLLIKKDKSGFYVPTSTPTVNKTRYSSEKDTLHPILTVQDSTQIVSSYLSPKNTADSVTSSLATDSTQSLSGYLTSKNTAGLVTSSLAKDSTQLVSSNMTPKNTAGLVTSSLAKDSTQLVSSNMTPKNTAGLVTSSLAKDSTQLVSSNMTPKNTAGLVTSSLAKDSTQLVSSNMTPKNTAGLVTSSLAKDSTQLVSSNMTPKNTAGLVTSSLAKDSTQLVSSNMTPKNTAGLVTSSLAKDSTQLVSSNMTPKNTAGLVTSSLAKDSTQLVSSNMTLKNIADLVTSSLAKDPTQLVSSNMTPKNTAGLVTSSLAMDSKQLVSSNMTPKNTAGLVTSSLAKDSTQLVSSNMTPKNIAGLVTSSLAKDSTQLVSSNMTPKNTAGLVTSSLAKDSTQLVSSNMTPKNTAGLVTSSLAMDSTQLVSSNMTPKNTAGLVTSSLAKDSTQLVSSNMTPKNTAGLVTSSLAKDSTQLVSSYMTPKNTAGLVTSALAKDSTQLVSSYMTPKNTAGLVTNALAKDSTQLVSSYMTPKNTAGLVTSALAKDSTQLVSSYLTPKNTATLVTNSLAKDSTHLVSSYLTPKNTAGLVTSSPANDFTHLANSIVRHSVSSPHSAFEPHLRHLASSPIVRPASSAIGLPASSPNGLQASRPTGLPASSPIGHVGSRSQAVSGPLVRLPMPSPQSVSNPLVRHPMLNSQSVSSPLLKHPMSSPQQSVSSTLVKRPMPSPQSLSGRLDRHSMPSLQSVSSPLVRRPMPSPQSLSGRLDRHSMPSPQSVSSPLIRRPMPSPHSVSSPLVRRPMPSPQTLSGRLVRHPMPSPQSVSSPLVRRPIPSPRSVSSPLVRHPMPSPQSLSRRLVRHPMPSPQSLSGRLDRHSMPSPQSVSSPLVTRPMPSPRSLSDRVDRHPMPSPQSLSGRVDRHPMTSPQSLSGRVDRHSMASPKSLSGALVSHPLPRPQSVSGPLTRNPVSNPAKHAVCNPLGAKDPFHPLAKPLVVKDDEYPLPVETHLASSPLLLKTPVRIGSSQPTVTDHSRPLIKEEKHPMSKDLSQPLILKEEKPSQTVIDNDNTESSAKVDSTYFKHKTERQLAVLKDTNPVLKRAHPDNLVSMALKKIPQVMFNNSLDIVHATRNTSEQPAENDSKISIYDSTQPLCNLLDNIDTVHMSSPVVSNALDDNTSIVSSLKSLAFMETTRLLAKLDVKNAHIMSNPNCVTDNESCTHVTSNAFDCVTHCLLNLKYLALMKITSLPSKQDVKNTHLISNHNVENVHRMSNYDSVTEKESRTREMSNSLDDKTFVASLKTLAFMEVTHLLSNHNVKMNI